MRKLALICGKLKTGLAANTKPRVCISNADAWREDFCTVANHIAGDMHHESYRKNMG